MRKPPAFQSYASDLLASEEFKLATLEARGLIWSMILQCWVSDSVPRNPADLAKVLGLSNEQVTRLLSVDVLRFFEEQDGRLIRTELVEQKAEMIRRREEQSTGGKKGAKARWRMKKTGLGKSMGNPSQDPLGAPEKSGVKQRSGEVSGASISNIVAEDMERDIEEYKRAFGS